MAVLNVKISAVPALNSIGSGRVISVVLFFVEFGVQI